MKKLALFAAIFVMAVLPSFAVEYPDWVEEYVNDFANVVSTSDANRIRTMLGDVESQTGIEITVVTISSLADYQANGRLRDYAAQLFDKWGVGDSKRNDGVMILFSEKDREVWIEAGLGYKNRRDDELQKVVNADMLPFFREGDYSRGLYEGARGVMQVVTTEVSWWSYYKWPLILFALFVLCIIAGVSCIRSGKKGWGYVFFATAGVILLFLIKILASSRGGKSGGFGGGRSGGGGAGGKW